jgi:plasmid stabilization system protein ParE
VKVVWTAESRNHLTRIYDYVSVDSAAYAKRLVHRITRRADILESFPNSGAKVPEYDDPAVREVKEGYYRIVYRVTAKRIEILAVFHGAQQLPAEPPSVD